VSLSLREAVLVASDRVAVRYESFAKVENDPLGAGGGQHMLFPKRRLRPVFYTRG